MTTTVFNRDSLDMTVYRKKFADCERVLSSAKDLKDYKPLLGDPTTFAYLYFKDDQGHRFRLYPYQDKILNDGHDRIYFRASNQIGKDQPYSAKVLTSNGFISMGDVVPGTKVYGSDGKEYTVNGISEQGINKIYRLTFDDDSWCECGLGHLWKIQLPKNRFRANFNGRWKRNKDSELGKWDVLPLNKIIELYGLNPSPPNRVIIPVTRPIDFGRNDIMPLHPYVVGVILGDGSMAHQFGKQITSGDSELIEHVRSRLPIGYNIIQSSCNKFHYYISHNNKHGWLKLFKDAGLSDWGSEDKRIPDMYLYSSIDNRIAILRGLMDTDGTIGGKCCCEFYSKSKYLAEGVQFLVQSLGGKATIKEKSARYKKDGIYKECGVCYRVIIKLESINPFLLSRKANKHYKIRYRKERVLRKIEYIRDEQSRCIVVDSPDNTYLTNNCIVTHNSTTFNIKAARNLVIDHGHAHNEAIVSKSLPQAFDQMRRIKTLLNTASFTWKQDTGLTESMSVITIDIKNYKNQYLYTNKLICAPCTEGLLGYDLHELNLDEFEFWDIDLKYFYTQIAQPRTYSTKGRIMVMTNPNGSDGYGTELESQTMKDGGNRWHVYVFNYMDKPGNSQEDYEQLKHELDRRTFDSTVDAIRTTSDRAYFTPDEIESSYDKQLEMQKEIVGIGKYTYWFLDIGTSHDQSVLTGCYVEPSDSDSDSKFNSIYLFQVHKYPVGYPLSRVVGVDTPEQASDGWHHEKSVVEYLKEYSIGGYYPVFGCDVTGNSGIVPLFQSLDIPVVDVVFSGPEKSAMFQRFKYFMEKKLLHRIKDSDWERQAAWLYAERSSRGYLQVHNINHFQKQGKFKGIKVKEDLDDCMASTAGLISIADPRTDTQVSFKSF